LQLVHQGLVFDNSGAEPRPVFEMRGGRVRSLTDKIPEWAAALLEGTPDWGNKTTAARLTELISEEWLTGGEAIGIEVGDQRMNSI
jgi:hypothetical protein